MEGVTKVEKKEHPAIMAAAGEFHKFWQEEFRKNPQNSFDNRFTYMRKLEDGSVEFLNQEQLNADKVSGEDEQIAPAAQPDQIWFEENGEWVQRRYKSLHDINGKKKWLNDNKGNPVNDLLSTPFEELDLHWQKDNIEAAKIACKIFAEMKIQTPPHSFDINDKATIDIGAKRIHDEFLRRRKESGAWISKDQDKPYEELTEEEKDKDRRQFVYVANMYPGDNTFWQQAVRF